jgi:small subunit ribosomal protein S1
LKHPSKLVKPADEVETVVLSVNPADRRISLGMKQLLENPWENLTEKYPAGTIVEGRVRNLTDFGAFIEIEDGIDGLVHVSNLSWTKRVKHPSEIVKKGEKVKAVVLGVEPQNRRLSLGIKQLQPDVWESFFATHRVGDQVHGKVLRTAQFGAFVEIAEGVEGLCHISEAGDEGGGPSKLETGLEHDFKIIKINVEEKKVGLSLRAVGHHEASRAQVESYKKESHKAPVSSSTTTLGDLINWKSERYGDGVRGSRSWAILGRRRLSEMDTKLSISVQLLAYSFPCGMWIQCADARRSDAAIFKHSRTLCLQCLLTKSYTWFGRRIAPILQSIQDICMNLETLKPFFHR